MADTSQLDEAPEGNRSATGTGVAVTPRQAKRPQPPPQIQLPFAPESANIIISDREQLRGILTSLPIILFALDRRATLLMLEGKGVAGLTPPQRAAVGKSVFELFKESNELRKCLAHALDGNVVNWLERLGDRSFNTTISPLRDRGEGSITGLMGIALEVPAGSAELEPKTVAAADDAAAVLTNRSMFLAQVSHEFRTPLNSIVGFANLLTRNGNTPQAEQDLFYVQRIIGNVTHLLGVVEDMLNLTVIDTGRIAVSLSEVNLGDLILETISELEHGPSVDAPELRTTIPAGALPLETDKQKLKQVLINLLANARKFTQKGTVTVSLVLDEFFRPARIDVEDTGVGISNEMLGVIFDAFERADSPTGQPVEGTGLGLTISRALCQLMGYGLTVKSEPGKGSVFTVDFSRRQGSQSS